MTMNKKTRNKLIIISVSIFAAAVAAVGIWLAVQYQNDRKNHGSSAGKPDFHHLLGGSKQLLRHGRKRLRTGAVSLQR